MVPIIIVKLRRKRKRNELTIDKKQFKIPMLQTTLYTVTTNQSLLERLVRMGSFYNIKPGMIGEFLTSQKTNQYILQSV